MYIPLEVTVAVKCAVPWCQNTIGEHAIALNAIISYEEALPVEVYVCEDHFDFLGIEHTGVVTDNTARDSYKHFYCSKHGVWYDENSACAYCALGIGE